MPLLFGNYAKKQLSTIHKSGKYFVFVPGYVTQLIAAIVADFDCQWVMFITRFTEKVQGIARAERRLDFAGIAKASAGYMEFHQEYFFYKWLNRSVFAK
jgi:hypothetical protein